MMSNYYPYRGPEPRPRRAPIWPVLLIVLLGGILCVLFLDRGFGWRLLRRNPEFASAVEPRLVTGRGDLSQDEEATIDIYKQTGPSVVNVTNLAERRHYMTLDVTQVPKGSGTGFVWDDSGIIVTNAHVVNGADTVEVVFPDKGRSAYETKTWLTYPDKDLAVLYVDAPKNKLKPIPRIGTSSDLLVGQKTYAIGNPFGLDQTLTTGIVSALNRKITAENGQEIQGVIQTSAPINPGNSGGPLLDSTGRLIGVNTAILSPSGTFAGIGFAIPIDEVNRIVPDMVAQLGNLVKNRSGATEYEPPRLGITPASDQDARRLGIEEGVVILQIERNSPAATAGLRPYRRDPTTRRWRRGDIIVAIDGKPVKSARDVFSLMDGRRFGDVVKLSIDRDGERIEVPVTLEPRGRGSI